MTTANTRFPELNAARPARRARPAGRRGVGLVELLLALAISASILVAVAYAVDVSFRSYSANQEQTGLMQRARVTMHRITTQIRTTAAHQPASAAPLADFKAGKITTDNAILMSDEDGNSTSYKYDPATKTVTCVDFNGNEFVALRNVEAFQIKYEPMRSELSLRTGGAFDLLMRATVTLTIRSAGQNPDMDDKFASQTVTLNASVVPRCNVW